MRKNTSKVQLDLLTASQRRIFLDLGKIAPNGILGGGTAIMLLLAHRKSYDFDVFLNMPIKKQLLFKLKDVYKEKLERPLVDSEDELTVQVFPNLKLSFIHFPFKPLHETIVSELVALYAKEDLASNKAYVIGRRGAWRDYVDLFSLLKDGVDFTSVIREAKKRFGGAFSEKLFLEQLTYFDDITDFTSEYIGREYSSGEIKKYFETLVREYTAL